MRNRPKNQINITFIRHGATQSNREARYVGWTDEVLSEEGRKLLKDRWKEAAKVQKVFSSPMKRCLETAEIIFHDCNPMVIEDWKEIDFGSFEGKNYLELSGDFYYQQWIDSNGTIPFPEGESREAFIARTMRGLEQCIAICKEEGLCDIACVVHGGTVMAIASQILGGEYYSYQIKTGEEYRITIDIESKEES